MRMRMRNQTNQQQHQTTNQLPVQPTQQPHRINRRQKQQQECNNKNKLAVVSAMQQSIHRSNARSLAPASTKPHNYSAVALCWWVFGLLVA